MKIIFTPGVDGVISNAGRIDGQPLPDNAVVADFAGETLDLAPATAAVWRDGKIQILANWIGSGPWYDQQATLEQREMKREILALGIVPPNDLGQPVSKGWERMAMTPRPLTKAELAAQAKAAADTKAAEDAAAKAKAEADEAARIASLTVSDVQFGLACVGAGIISAAEAEAWVARGEIPAALAAGIETLPADQQAIARIKVAGEKTFARSNPFVAMLGVALGKTGGDLDQLFLAASAL